MSSPVKGVAFQFSVSLADTSDSASFLASPTIVAGDFKISKDGGAFVNLSALPVVNPGSSVNVQINLNATEMNADEVVVIGVDQTTNKEWDDIRMDVPTPSGGAEQIFDIVVGDVTETAAKTVTVRRGTAITLVEKDITGSFLGPLAILTTKDPSP